MRTTVANLVAVVLAAGLLLSAPSPALGASKDACSGDNQMVSLHENKIRDTSDGDDWVGLCGDRYENLGWIAHTPPTGCKGDLFIADAWSDCASSAYVRIPKGRMLVFYNDAWLRHPVQCWYGPNEGRFDFGHAHDLVTSLAFASGSCKGLPLKVAIRRPATR